MAPTNTAANCTPGVASHVHAIPTVGLRFFNVYGPRQDPKSPYSGVISIFCERIATGAPVTIFGDGQQTRDFVYVADVVAALLAAMSLRPSGSPVFNVCTGVATSVAALAHLIADLAGMTLDVQTGPPRAGEIRHSLGVPGAGRYGPGSVGTGAVAHRPPRCPGMDGRIRLLTAA